jgi:tryptophan-rich hypothetical protein
MNRINPKKLLASKWTAVQPVAKEKHFVITQVVFDEDGNMEKCIIEAVHSKRERELDWRQLKNEAVWSQGWK